jgi:hypothetical protein
MTTAASGYTEPEGEEFGGFRSFVRPMAQKT